VYFESPGTAHDWLTWRRTLNDFAPVSHDSPARRIRQQHVGRRFMAVHRKHCGLGADERRSRIGLRLSSGRNTNG
jgi:hypothetical protein